MTSKRKNLIALVAGWLTLSLGIDSVAQTADGSSVGSGEAASEQFGTITGRVSNMATTVFLHGARVEVVGTANSTTTDRDGYYRLRVPAGRVIVAVSYLGLDRQTVAIEVPSQGTVERDIGLTAEIYTLERVEVSGPREGYAAAITAQREAPNVKNIVTSDAFGNLADGNIGDFLQQLPGVVANYTGQDVRTVSIRGIDGGLNTVTMDGGPVASSQSAGAGREFEFEQASLNLIETIEVTKAPTPDMDAASIGGNVNLVSKSAFDRTVRRYFTYSIGGVYRPKYFTRMGHWAKEPIANIGPSMNFTYADRLGAKENIGILLTGTYHSQPGGGPASLMGHQTSMVDPYWINSITVPRPAGAPRTRLSAGLKIDYKQSEHTIVSFNTAYNHFHENNDTRGMALATTQNAANFRPGYSSRFVEILPNNNSTSTINISTNDKSGRTWILSPSVRHRYPSWEIDYAAGWSNSRTFYDHSPYNRHYKSRPKGQVALSLRNIGFIIDRTESLEWPKVIQTAGPDIYDLANYSGLLLSQLDRGGEDEIKTLRLNAKKSIDLRFPTFIKVGGAYKGQDRQLWRNSRRYNYIGPAGSTDIFLATDGKWSDTNVGYRQPPWPSPYAIARHVITNPEFWNEDLTFARTARLANDRQIAETVSAVYAMGQTRIGKLSILAGVRGEETRTDAEGPVQVNGVYTEERVRRKGSYRDFFPSVHFRYAPTSGLVVRASYSNGIGRPSFDQLMPLETINETTMVINARNTALRPQYADNFDVSVEYYFEPVGSLTASVFLKEVKDFHFSTTMELDGTDGVYGPEYAGYRLTTRLNGGQARYRGFELGYQQMFTFLPGFWRGFGVYSNYTHLDTRGDYGTATVTTLVPGMVPRTANFAISYLGGKWNVRVNALWRAATLRTTSANEATMLWDYERYQINLKTRYSFSRNTAVFCDVENVTSVPTVAYYRGNKDRPAETRKITPKIIMGVSGRF